MKAGYVVVEKNELDMLMGLCAMMYKAGQHTVDQGRVWVHLGQKLMMQLQFSDEEVDLMQLAVGEVLKRGQKALERISEDRPDARIRARVVEQTYLNIQEKLNNVVFTEVRNPVDQSPEDLSGGDKVGQDADANNDPLPGGDSSPPASD